MRGKGGRASERRALPRLGEGASEMTARSWAVALVLAASAPIWAATPKQHVAAARAAEKRSDWRKALREWQAAYRMEINAEYLIGIGDAHARLGNKVEARRQYEAYLADPLALPANAARVKGKIAALGAPAGQSMALALPVPAADAKGKQAAAAPPLPALDIPAPLPPAPAKKTEVALALPELPKPGAASGTQATAPAPLPLPGLDVPALPTAADVGKKPGAAPAAGPAKPAQTIAAATPPPSAKPAVAKTPPTPAKAPSEAVTAAETPRPTPTSDRGGGAQRVVAWVAAGVAVAALGGGALAYSKASSAQSDLTSKVRSGAEAQSLLEQEKQNKTLSFVGLAGGLVAAGIAVALFTF